VRLAGLALALVAAGCGDPPVVVLDLAERLPVAEREAPDRELILFGTRTAEPYEAEGFHPWSGGPGDRFVLARREVEVATFWDAPRPRIAILDVAPFEAIDAQSVEIALNGTPVAELDLSERRQRYRIALPPEPQLPGANRIAFEFAKTASRADVDPASRDRGQVAAAFFGMSLGSADDEGLEDLLRRDAPPVYGRSEQRGVPGFWQVGPSTVRFAVRLPPDAELHAAPALHLEAAAAGVAVTARVTVTPEGEEEHEIWRRELSAAEPEAEVSVGLPGRAGDVVLVGLHVEGPGRLQWVDWRGPRITGVPDGGSGERGRRRAAQIRDALKEANVLLVVLDAARAQQFGCYGYERATTPEIDRIAAEGVVFDRFFTPAVYTLAAMSAVWTAEPPDRHRTETSFSARLPEDRLTLAELLTAQGIRTAGFVANPVAGEAFGFQRGFSEFQEVFRDSGSSAEAFRDALPPLWEELSRGRERFFAYVHLREPHFPYDPPAPFDSRFGSGGPISKAQRSEMEWITDVNQGRRVLTEAEQAHLVRLYDGNLAYADREVGRIRADLEGAGLWDRTVVIVTADHGEALGEHGWIGHNVQLFDPSIRIPLIVRFPAGLGPTGRSASLADLTDLAPTIADLFGVLGRGGSDEAFQGRSLLPVLGGAPGRELVVSRSVWDSPIYAVRDEGFKLVHDTRSGDSQLFDLEADPDERTDVASQRPVRALYYLQELDAWIASQRRRVPSGPGAAPTEEQCRVIAALGYVNAECAAAAE